VAGYFSRARTSDSEPRTLPRRTGKNRARWRIDAVGAVEAGRTLARVSRSNLKETRGALGRAADQRDDRPGSGGLVRDGIGDPAPWRKPCALGNGRAACFHHAHPRMPKSVAPQVEMSEEHRSGPGLTIDSPMSEPPHRSGNPKVGPTAPQPPDRTYWIAHCRELCFKRSAVMRLLVAAGEQEEFHGFPRASWNAAWFFNPKNSIWRKRHPPSSFCGWNLLFFAPQVLLLAC